MKVRYEGDVGHFDGLSYGVVYDVIGENETQYVIFPNVHGDKSTIQKSKFSIIETSDLSIIKRIELALGFELYDWQKLYILNGKWYAPIGRGVGTTTAYCIRLALTDKTYSLKEIEKLRDENHNSTYTRWFRSTFLAIRDGLKHGGIKVCEIKN